MALFDQYMIDLLGLACDRLLGTFGQSKTGIQPLLDSLVNQTQDWNNISKTVFEGRFLDVAEGVQLDIIGDIVGIERPFVDADEILYFQFDEGAIGQAFDGFSGWFVENAPINTLVPVDDTIYRQFIYGKIFKNQVTGGSIPEMMQFIKLTFNVNASIVYASGEPLGYYILVDDGLPPQFIAYLLGSVSDNTVENDYNVPTPVATRNCGVIPIFSPTFTFDMENAEFGGFDVGGFTIIIPPPPPL